ncbi:hypothetical protein MAR_028249 [Mya arenaria]|uniref:Uncharacterized protein n=1 Tax=Mya arenaria TaxID=6604 RepID=A0ABY7DE55_MYAAR|nr:hypothetical protein MAR_028249 [Mya arenaria]
MTSSRDLLEQTSAETHILCVDKCSKDDNVDASLRCNAVRYNALDKSCELVLSRGCEAPAAALQAHWTIYRLYFMFK